MKLIVAVDERWGIGKDGDLLLSIPADMQFFREKTRGKVLVMGYNTLLSFPHSKPLPARLNIVLNDAEGCKVSGAVVCRSIPQMLGLVSRFDGGDVFVIGGGSIYRQLLPYCDTAYITKMCFDGAADTFIPDLDALGEWSVEEVREQPAFDGIGYAFVTYRNASPIGQDFCADDGTLSAYFSKKAELSFSVSDNMDKKALAERLNAYFYPLADGFSAGDVDGFLQSGERSFERYLRACGALSAAKDIEALTDGGETCRVKVKKEELERFLVYFETHSAEETAAAFAE